MHILSSVVSKSQYAQQILVVWVGVVGIVKIHELPPPAFKNYFSHNLGLLALI